MSAEIRDGDWTVILSSLARGRCGVLVGQRLTVGGTNGQSLDLSSALARRLAQQLEDDGADVRDRDNLSLVAQLFIDRFDRSSLEVVATDFYREHDTEPTPGDESNLVFENLAALPIPVFVTSRHDRRLAQCLRLQGREPQEASYHFRGDQRQTVGEVGTVDRPLVYYLLGSVDDPSSLVLTENDLLDALKAIAADEPRLPTDVRNEFTHKSFLFFGCGLHFYYSRLLLHLLEFGRSEQRSFALETAPVDDEAPLLGQFERSIWFYRLGYKKPLKVIDLEPHAFTSELRTRWETAHPPGTFQPPSVREIQAPSLEQPKVFVSYMSEDRDFAARFVEALRAHGVDPWFDRERLDFGDRWDDALTDAIEKDADFFVVLLSSHLDEGSDTYVHQEITSALRRKHQRGAVKFIYPVEIDPDACRLQALEREKIQVAPVMNLVADVPRLASSIRREFAKLRRR